MAGAARGRRLVVPAGRDTRPTSDRAREAMFSTLESMLGSLAGSRFLDLYAGSGAVGLEARSRGSAGVLLVESDSRALRAVADNVAAVGLDGVEVRRGQVQRLARQRPSTPYDLVFLDPPYALARADLAAVLGDLLGNGWLARGAVVVVERATRDGWDWPAGFVADRSRRYGEATLWYGRAAGPSSTSSEAAAETVEE
ncbi:MAG: rRNA (guanine966-N2)-methyltransferase [Actinomycetota bacterium]|nr:rRNA (guanine966-N2)-methyltransferase [Actinomycetota bacterium]